MKYTDYEYTPEEVEQVKKILIDMWEKSLVVDDGTNVIINPEVIEKLYDQIETISLKELCDKLHLAPNVYPKAVEILNNNGFTSKLKFGGYLLAKFASFKICRATDGILPEISYKDVQKIEEIKMKKKLINLAIARNEAIKKTGFNDLIENDFKIFAFIKSKLEEDPILFCQIANDIITTYEQDTSEPITYDTYVISKKIYFYYNKSNECTMKCSPSNQSYREDIKRATDYLDMIIKNKG